MVATPIETRVSLEAFEQFITLPENANRDFEYVGGKIIETVDTVSILLRRLFRGLESPLCREMEMGLRRTILETSPPPLNAVLPNLNIFSASQWYEIEWQISRQTLLHQLCREISRTIR